MKKFLIGVAVCIGLLVLGIGGLMAATFGGLKPLDAGAELPEGVTIAVDGFAAIFVVPTPSGGLILVDAGDDPNGAPILAALKKLNRSPDSVKAVLLTHGHPDHVSGAHLFSAAQVYAFEADKGLAAGTERGKGPLPKLMGPQKDKVATVTQFFKDGQPFELEGLKVTAFSIPGHTAGSAAILVGETLFLGDSANGGADGSLKATPWLFSDDVEQNRQSLRALAKRLKEGGVSVKTLAFGHSAALNSADALYAF